MREEILASIKSIVNDMFGIEPDSITEESNMYEDLSVDSLDLVALISELEDKYDIHIPTDTLTEIRTIAELIDTIESMTK